MVKKIVSVLIAAAMTVSLAACGGSGTASTGSAAPAAESKAEAASTAEAASPTAATESKAAEENAELPAEVNIGVQTLVTPELIARYEKLYEEYLGCKVNLLQFDSGADVNRAFASKSIDIGMIGTSPAAIGISTDLGFEVIWFSDVIGAAETLVAKEDSGIKTVKDLVGKKVATPFASTAHFSLQNAMSLNGVNPADVELFDMQPDDIYAAWVRGDIDAAYVWDPVLSKLFAEGGVSITNSAELAEQGTVTADLVVINKEFAEKYPSIPTGYIKAQLYAIDLFNTDKDKAVTEISEAISITKEEAETQVNGFKYPDGAEQLTDAYFGADGESGEIAQILKKSADFLVEQGSIDSAPDLSVFEEYSTGEYILRAMNE